MGAVDERVGGIIARRPGQGIRHLDEETGDRVVVVVKAVFSGVCLDSGTAALVACLTIDVLQVPG